jgi:hypothetical protein
MMATLKDELIKHFSPAGLPNSDDPNINNTVGARQSTGESTPPFPPTATEYKQPPTTLPTQVSQSEILAQNENRGDNMWTAKDGNK